MTGRKFYRARYVVDVLSESPISGSAPLHVIAHNIDEGEWSGEVNCVLNREISGRAAAIGLQRQGSDPSFFRLSPGGGDLDGRLPPGGSELDGR